MNSAERRDPPDARNLADLLAELDWDMQNACVPSITIRDVPPDARDELAARAAASGKSLQQYLRAELIDLAHRPDNARIMAEVREHKRRLKPSLDADDILDHRNSDRR